MEATSTALLKFDSLVMLHVYSADRKKWPFLDIYCRSICNRCLQQLSFDILQHALNQNSTILPILYIKSPYGTFLFPMRNKSSITVVEEFIGCFWEAEACYHISSYGLIYEYLICSGILKNGTISSEGRNSTSWNCSEIDIGICGFFPVAWKCK